MKRVPILIPFLILVSMLFLGILIFTYVATKKANPQMIRTTSVGRTPWSARGPLAPLFAAKQADRGVGRGPGGPPHQES